MGDDVLYAILDSPLGPVHTASTRTGICALALRTTTDRFVAEVGRMTVGRLAAATSAVAADPRRRHLDRLAAGLTAYFGGNPGNIVASLDLRVASAWDRRILEVVQTIGFGQTLSYGGVAIRAGAPGAARAVGGAVGRNPIGLLIPCHRVIAGDGSIGGYGGSWFGDREELLALKRSLLVREGVAIRG